MIDLHVMTELSSPIFYSYRSVTLQHSSVFYDRGKDDCRDKLFEGMSVQLPINA